MDTLTFQLGFYYGTSLGYFECMAELAKIHIARMSELGDKQVLLYAVLLTYFVTVLTSDLNINDPAYD